MEHTPYLGGTSDVASPAGATATVTPPPAHARPGHAHARLSMTGAPPQTLPFSRVPPRPMASVAERLRWRLSGWFGPGGRVGRFLPF